MIVCHQFCLSGRVPHPHPTPVNRESPTTTQSQRFLISHSSAPLQANDLHPCLSWPPPPPVFATPPPPPSSVPSPPQVSLSLLPTVISAGCSAVSAALLSATVCMKADSLWGHGMHRDSVSPLAAGAGGGVSSLRSSSLASTTPRLFVDVAPVLSTSPVGRGGEF